MTGELILFGDPVDPLGATPKQYVDSVAFINPPDNKLYAAKAGLLPVGFIPLMKHL
jgi:hypothetical protein